MGKFIDTVVDESFMRAAETVNCCQHVEDLKAIGNSRYRNIDRNFKGLFTPGIRVNAVITFEILFSLKIV